MWKHKLKRNEQIQTSTGQATVLDWTWDQHLKGYWIKLLWTTGRTAIHKLITPNKLDFGTPNGHFFKIN
jgi:hypothetical protein